MSRLLIAIVALFFSTSAILAGEADAKAARVMWSAFLCSQYSSIKKDQVETQRLFKVGYAAGQRFLAAALAGTITQEETKSTVPMAVGFRMSGPTTEFVLGRIFESATNDAFGSIVEKDENGVMLDMKNWIMDETLRASIAETKYSKANCETL